MYNICYKKQMPSTVRWKFFSYDMIACVEYVIYPPKATPGKQLWDPSHLCSWPHIRTQRITGRALRICLQPIGMSTVAILTGHSWDVLLNPDSSQPVPGSEIVGSAELRKREHENNFHLCVIPTVLEPLARGMWWWEGGKRSLLPPCALRAKTTADESDSNSGTKG